MIDKKIDISDTLTWEEGIPVPQWELLGSWVESQVAADEAFDAWTDIARQWLERVGAALDADMRVYESANVLLLSNSEGPSPEVMLRFAEQCRAGVVAILGDIAKFTGPGKGVVIVLNGTEMYYNYVAHRTPEGLQGTSAGMQIRAGYPHIAMNSGLRENSASILAHESMHAALMHLTLPQWVEEGLAMMFQHDMSACGLLQINKEMADKHKKHWKKNSLDDFWRGGGFYRAGKVQELSYQLAEILMRLLVEDHGPRWFGFAKERQKQFYQFLRFAEVMDCGAEAAQSHLSMTLSDIAGKFLGPGEWEPSL